MSGLLRILIGGSPCTHWSIAQSKNRETLPSGEGWELFKNYLIAKEQFKPDFFLYENNVSAAEPIKAQIRKELNVWDGTMLMPYNENRYIEINSALVSAQNRERFYCHNFPNVGQPEDRGILLRDVLDSGVAWNEKAYVLTASYSGAVAWNTIERSQRSMIAESVRIGTIESSTNTDHDSKPFRVYSPYGKGVTLQGEAGGLGAKTGLYATPIEYNIRPDCELIVSDSSIRVANKDGHGTSQGYTVMFVDGKSATVTSGQAMKLKIIEPATYAYKPIYEVRNGLITIKDKQYPIKLPDGFYIIRKLTVKECRRLQTIPDWYKMPCSPSQNYKMLGNGWTVKVIEHISNSLAGQAVEVLSMYDGMSCGRIALEELGCKVVKYTAYEIDKYAIQTTMANFPDTIQMGDAFGVRKETCEV
jgi:site-specific DNA-cytosine methylase